MADDDERDEHRDPAVDTSRWPVVVVVIDEAVTGDRIDALRVLVPAAVTVVAADRLDHVRSMIAGGMFTMPFDSWATATIDDGVAWVAERLGG